MPWEATLVHALSDWLEAMAPSIVITAPIWVDAVVTLAVRALGRRPLAQAHRTHLYQRMLDDGRSPWTVALSYWSYACACTAVAVVGADHPGPAAAIGTVLVAIGVICVVGLHRLGLAISPFRPLGDQEVE